MDPKMQPEGDDSSYSDSSESNLGPREVEKVKSLIDQLEPLAEKEGCEVSELVDKYASSEDDSESNSDGDDGNKVALIVARMKAKQGGSDDSEG